MSNWNILLENMDDGSTVATVLEFPNLRTSDKTKQGAIKKVRQLLQQRLAKAEVIQISVETESNDSENSVMKFAGIFKGDQDFADIMAGIRAEREHDGEI